MNVALIQCPVWGTYDPPLALAQLSSCLKRAGHKVLVSDLNIKLYLNRTDNYRNMWAWEQSLFWYNDENVAQFFEKNKNLIVKYIDEILNANPRVIGFSVNAASKVSSLILAKMIKRTAKDITIVWGGPLFFEKRFVEDILSEGVVDIVIPGEAEFTLVELINFIDKNKDINDCQGIYFKANGKISNTPDRPQITNLDILPFLDFSDLPLSDYDDYRHIIFMASRGCVQRCVFCSSRAFWPGYRAMSGRRIFEELKFHKERERGLNPHLGHVDFLDLVFNGNMKYLMEFCDLIREARLDIKWSANMIIRKEMTSVVIEKMKEAGCEHIIFGIESGSQRVLNLMQKYYQIEDAYRIIRELHEAGIKVTGNFMFGFPGETEEDFKETLSFIKRNAGFLDRAYPSRTYCAIEEFSYLSGHLEEFGIKPNPANHLFWESVDGINIYPVRLQRCREFSELASSLSIEVGCGVQTSVQLDEFLNLFQYYEAKRDYENAIHYLLKSFDTDSSNEVVRAKVRYYFEEVVKKSKLCLNDNETLTKLNKTGERIMEEFSPSYLTKTDIYNSDFKNNDNIEVNKQEFSGRKVLLQSTPTVFHIELSGPCNSQCAFCYKGNNYEQFNLKTYQNRFEHKITNYLAKSEKIVFSGMGEFLLLPGAEEILSYFTETFPQVGKVFYTNGSNLTPNFCEKMLASKSQYTVCISLHASNRMLHSTLTRTENFYKIIGQVKYLVKKRKEYGTTNLNIHLVFVATTLNIDDLVNFVILSGDLGVDKVICRYNHIYNQIQKFLSCFFKQDITNCMIDKASKAAYRLNLPIELPPQFGNLNHQSPNGICGLPWSKIIIGSRGRIKVCDRLGESGEILDTKDFIDVWNGRYYQNLRKQFMEDNCPCIKHCIQMNPSSVNDFSSHIIHPDAEHLGVTWGDNF